MNGIKPRKANTERTPGVISINEIYTLEEIRMRLRWSDSAVRSAKRKGLKLIKHGKRKYVSGEEIFRYLNSLPEEPNNGHYDT